jgi:Ca2+-binding EF-hand superfamily protein
MSAEEIRAILADENKLKEVVKAAFESVDTDGSGFIDAPELKKVMSSVAGDIGMPEPSDNDVIEVMRELDANNDGKISEDEFKVLIKQVLELMLST